MAFILKKIYNSNIAIEQKYSGIHLTQCFLEHFQLSIGVITALKKKVVMKKNRENKSLDESKSYLQEKCEE